MTHATRPTLEELVTLADEARAGGAVTHPDQAVADAVAIMAEAAGHLTLHVSRASGAIDFQGWFSRSGAVLASETGSTGTGSLKLAVFSIERLATRIASLVDLGPRPDSGNVLQLLVPRVSLDAILSGPADAAAAALGVPADELPWVAGAFASPDLTHWRLTVEGVNAEHVNVPRTEIDVIDSPASSCWLLVGETESGEVVLASTTPRALWIALTTVLPCWDGVTADDEQPSAR